MNKKCLVVTLACTFLAACGGGDGGSAPPSNTAPAAITASNVNSLINDAALAVAMGITSRVGPFLVPDSPGPPVVAHQDGFFAQGAVTFALNSDGNNNVTGTGTYNSFNGGASLTLSGPTNVTGIFFFTSGGGFPNSLLTFSDLSYTHTGTNEVLHFSGTIELAWKPTVMGSAGYVMKGNGTVRNSNQATLFTLQNFQIDSDIVAGQQNILVSGRIIDVTLGFVDLSTATRFTFALPGSTIWSGSFAMTGAGQTATVTYTNGIPSAIIN